MARPANPAVKRRSEEEFALDCKAAYLSVAETVNDKITTRDDLMLALNQSGRNPSLKQIAKYWKSSTKSFTYDDFSRVCKEIPATTSSDLLAAFKKMDLNGDGYISRNEFIKAMTAKGEKLTMEEVIAIIKQVDKNNDGKLDYEEFTDMLMQNMDDSKAAARKTLSKKDLEGSSGPRGSATNLKSSASTGSLNRSTEKLPRGGSRASFADDDDDDIVCGSSAPAKRGPSGAGGAAQTRGSDAASFEKTFGGKFDYREPRNLRKWTQVTRRGCFFYEESNRVKRLVFHAYEFNLTSPTSVLITIRPGDFVQSVDKKTMPDIAFAVFRGDKILAMSELANPTGMSFLRADLIKGTYRVVPITSGTKFRPRQNQPNTEAKLVKQERNGKIALTTAVKEALTDIFNMADFDGNGSLSKDEFGHYNLRTGGERLDDTLWRVVEENCRLKNGEITLEDFIYLNLREVEEDEGRTENLWITLENMGFNKQLLVDEAFPFLLDVYCEVCPNVVMKVLELETIDKISLDKALVEYVTSKGERVDLTGIKDCGLHLLTWNGGCMLVAENLSTGTRNPLRLKLECERSRNLVFFGGPLRVEASIPPDKRQLVMHAISTDPEKPLTLSFQVGRPT